MRFASIRMRPRILKKTALLDLAGAALDRNPMIYPPNGDALLGE